MRGLVAAALAVLAMLPRAASADGEALFNDVCAACHHKGGIGTAGLAPSLVSGTLKRTLSAQPDYVARVILQGLSGPIEVDGQRFVSAMPMQPQLSDAEIAALCAYVGKTLNGVSETPDEIAVGDLRAVPGDHAALRALRAKPGG